MDKFKFMAALIVFGFLCLAIAPASLIAGTITWKVQSMYRGAPADEDQAMLTEIEKVTGGRLKLILFQAGELVKPTETLDSVGMGLVQAGTDFPSTWVGKNMAFDLLATHPVSMSVLDFINWYYSGGGKELYQEVYGKYGVMYFPYIFLGPESGFRTNKPINKLSDFKGLKLRTAGFMTGKILQKLGASPTAVPFSEIYESLQRSVIDGCEVSTPHWDWILGFQEITKYVQTPPWHQPYGVCGLMVNKKAWESLPEDLQMVVEHGIQAYAQRRTSINMVRDSIAIEKFTKHGIHVTRLSAEDLDEIEKIKAEIQAELAAENPLYAKVLKSQMLFMKKMENYRDFSSPYFPGRNPKFYPDFK